MEYESGRVSKIKGSLVLSAEVEQNIFNMTMEETRAAGESALLVCSYSLVRQYL